MDEKALAALLAEYEQAELKLTGIVANYVMLGMDETMVDSTWAAQKLSQVKALAASTRQVLNHLAGLDDTAAGLVLDAYKAGLKVVPDGIIGTNIDAAELLAQDLVSKLTTSRFQILRKTVDAYRQIIGNVEAQTILGVNTRIQAARQALGKFADNGIVSFVDNLGREWTIPSYTEMATRTATNNALREGRIQGLANNERDLIIVSSAPNPSPLCAPYERKILSISGNDSRYDSLVAAKSNGLYHPNCRHSFTSYIPGETEIGKTDADKGYDNYDETQDLRHAENMTRKWKRRLEVATTDKDKDKANSKIKEWRDEAKTIAADNNLNYKPNRLSNKAAR